MDIATWLSELGLDRYEVAFRDNAIDADILPELTDADLEKLGVLLGHRKRLLKALVELRTGASAPASLPKPAVEAPRETRRATEAERRQLTVMFVDLVGSTALAAELDPEDMGKVIRAYQDCCAEVVRRWDGHVAKYMGDGVLAYFGWPQAHEDEAERAVRAGLAITGAVGHLSNPASEPLAARVGIATGLVMVGELIGEGAAQEPAVVGDTPHLAARLQAFAAPGSVVISQATRRLALLPRRLFIRAGGPRMRGATPDAERIAYARKVIAAFETSPDGLVVVEGKLIEIPVVRSARRTLAIAAATGAA